MLFQAVNTVKLNFKAGLFSSTFLFEHSFLAKSHRIKKVQKTDPPPNVAILLPYETLGQVSEIGNYFLGYFIIFYVFPMYFPM